MSKQKLFVYELKGYGTGNGYGDGNGSGNGIWNGSGNENGNGYGTGNGYGYGDSDGLYEYFVELGIDLKPEIEYNVQARVLNYCKELVGMYE